MARAQGDLGASVSPVSPANHYYRGESAPASGESLRGWQRVPLGGMLVGMVVVGVVELLLASLWFHLTGIVLSLVLFAVLAALFHRHVSKYAGRAGRDTLSCFDLCCCCCICKVNIENTDRDFESDPNAAYINDAAQGTDFDAVATALQNSAARQTDGQASKWQTRKLYSTVGNSLRWKAAITFAFNLSLFLLVLSIIHLISLDEDFPSLREACPSESENCKALGSRETVIGGSVSLGLFDKGEFFNSSGVWSRDNGDEIGLASPLLFSSNVKKLFAIARDWLEHKGDILRSKDIDGSCGDSAPAGSVALGAGFYAHARVLTPIMGFADDVSIQFREFCDTTSLVPAPFSDWGVTAVYIQSQSRIGKNAMGVHKERLKSVLEDLLAFQAKYVASSGADPFEVTDPNFVPPRLPSG